MIAIRSCEGSSTGYLFQRHHPRLLATALRLLGNRRDAESAVRETRLIAMEHVGIMRDPGSSVAWLYTALCRACLQRMRPRGTALPSDSSTDVVNAWAHPEQSLGRLEMRHWIRGVLERLPESVRETAMLSYFGTPSSLSEISVRLDVPIGRVRSRLLEAKVRLAEALLASSGLASGTHGTRSGGRDRF